MAQRISSELRKLLPSLRFEPTHRRVRGEASGTTVVDSERALVVYEPRRVTPVFGVPASDIAAELVPFGVAAETPEPAVPATFQLEAGGPPLLDPRHPFSLHTAEGTEYSLRTGTRELLRAAFRPADPDLADYVLLDFNAFDRWREEDEVISGHPRDPFHRVDARSSSRHVSVSFNGTLLAESRYPVFVYETFLPRRSYLPRGDVHWERLERTGFSSVCPYKGTASYWSVAGAEDGANIAWSYEATLPDSVQLQDLVCFFDERTDLRVDGIPTSPGTTPWSS